MTIQQPQAQALANLLHQLRPDWNVASMMALLGKHKDDHDFPALCVAATKAATNPDARTPAVIFLPGAHWDAGKPPQQFLTAAEKRRLQNAQQRGYFAVIDGTDIFDTSNPCYFPLIDPGDLNPAATLEAFKRGQMIAQLEIKQRQPAPPAIESNDPDTLEEAPLEPPNA